MWLEGDLVGVEQVVKSCIRIILFMLKYSHMRSHDYHMTDWAYWVSVTVSGSVSGTPKAGSGRQVELRTLHSTNQ